MLCKARLSWRARAAGAVVGKGSSNLPGTLGSRHREGKRSRIRQESGGREWGGEDMALSMEGNGEIFTCFGDLEKEMTTEE